MKYRYKNNLFIMSKLWMSVLIVLALMSSCNNQPKETNKNDAKEMTENRHDITRGEECSIKVSGIEFTKSINGAKEVASVEGDVLVIKSKAKSDNFNDPDGKMSNNSAPILLTKIDNTQPFTFTAKLTPTFTDIYDAGTMYIYLNPELWFKFAFEIDERKKTRMVTVRTTETSDDNNHDVVENASVYMKISSDVTNIGFYYSLDNINWQMVRLFKNEYPIELWTGLSAQSPVGNGTEVIFEDCRIILNSIEDFRMGI